MRERISPPPPAVHLLFNGLTREKGVRKGGSQLLFLFLGVRSHGLMYSLFFTAGARARFFRCQWCPPAPPSRFSRVQTACLPVSLVVLACRLALFLSPFASHRPSDRDQQPFHVIFSLTSPPPPLRRCCSFSSLPPSRRSRATRRAGSMHPEGGLGGKGESGMGATRGKASFESFTHRKVVAINTPNFDPKSKYPPYDVSDTKKKVVQFFWCGSLHLCRFTTPPPLVRLHAFPARPHARSTHQRISIGSLFCF